MRIGYLIVLSVFLIACSAGVNAHDWLLTAGLSTQNGSYEYTTGYFDFSVAQPPLVYMLEAKTPDNWILSAYFARSETGDATMDPRFFDLGAWTAKFQGTPFGHASQFRATIGRAIEIDDLQLTPTLSFESQSFAAGAEQTSETNQLTRHTFGLTATGLRVGLDIDAKLGNNLDLTLTGGFTPVLTVGELRYIFEGETPSVPGTKETYDIRFPHGQNSRKADYGIGLTYQLTPSVSLLVRYSYESTEAEFVKLADATGHGYCMADQWEFHSSTTQFGVNYQF